MIDEGFIKRTYRTSLVVWTIATLALFALELWFAAAGLAIGTAVSLGILAGFERVIRRTIVPGATGVGRTLVKFGALKLVVMVTIIFGVVATRRLDLILGFCAGIALTQVVMFLKVIGIMLIERMNR